ncbi:MAG: hypothetical protein GWP61_28385 [Chloroflexi bacterium]|jgi:hypothetical protein|nr:hypothetical protein [Chloroflexota bacterium]
MTEYEVADLAFSKIFQLQGMATLTLGLVSALGDAVQQYMTVLFAYIAAAHFIGASLERRQVVILTILYLLWQFWLLLVLVSRSYGLAFTIGNLRALDESEFGLPPFMPQLITFSSIILLLAALFASIYFMWSIRHPKPD